ncbi:hypothetical protein AN8042.2 [Aspergillus nidulans FGSC A4]|nr:hypothetical protein AN8042.2 [Aspergillus nidulans FGSC A4]|eukprot:XP_681311.1 hypothetical protein AN8042.2 [Aspergillus nidulans FGSC A4]
MVDDEDIIMGEAGYHSANPNTAIAAGQQTTHGHLNGRSDPYLAPPLLSQPMQMPVVQAGNSQTQESSATTDEARVLSPKIDLNSTVPADAADITPDYQDSLVDEYSDYAEESKEAPGLPLASLPSGLCYDVQMRYHCEVRPTSDVHPEDPRRIYYIYKELCRAGLVDDIESTRPLVARPLKRIHARNATEEEISLVHTAAHYAFVESTKDMSDEELIALEHTRDSIYFNNLTFASSLLSVGGAIETCLAVATRKVKNAIAVIRPPGHHAEHDKTMGFCLFNNVQLKETNHSRDVHHGNGIQKAFYDDPNVLYISLHVYQNGSFYPGEKDGDADFCGAGAGEGNQGMGDGDYIYAFHQVVMPIAQEFDPDLVIIASGFDAAAGDTLGGCFVTPACYAHMTHMLMTLAQGKVAVCLEGGYNFRSISKSALAVTKTLMGNPPDRLSFTCPSEAAISTIRRVSSIQSDYWKCMYPKAIKNEGVWTDRLHDIIRAYQAKQLYDNYKLTSLYIYRTAISKSFENQVLARPEIMGLPHPLTNNLEAHNCWLADVMKDYVQWAVGKGYAVIDVNIPKHVTTEPSSGRFEEEDENRPTATEELAGYLWDNYIDPNEATEIFLVGIGNAFYGVANLLINRETLYQRVNGVISFVAKDPVRAVASHTQVWLSRWYRDNSLVFVSKAHGVWKSDRKATKRYGKLIQSSREGLSDMLMHHKDEVFQWIEDRIEPESEETEEEKPVKRSPTKAAPKAA